MTDLPLPLVDSIVDRALAEDLGSGDITTEACIDADAIAVAHGVAPAPFCTSAGLAGALAGTALRRALYCEVFLDETPNDDWLVGHHVVVMYRQRGAFVD